MATVAIPPSGMSLHGAPDASIGTAEARFNKRQVIPIQMNQEVIDELLKSVRGGKPPQVFFGRTPVWLNNSSIRRLLYNPAVLRV